jgi:DNA-binding MarR family transcriptional regulator
MSPGHQIAMALRLAYWSMHRQADAHLAPLGVTANQFVLLALLAEDDGIKQSELVERASSDPNTVRAMLVSLEQKGLIARERHPTDGRAWCVTLSPRGRRAYRQLWSRSEPFRERLAADLRPDEVDTFLELLGRVTTAMTPHAIPSKRVITSCRRPQ